LSTPAAIPTDPDRLPDGFYVRVGVVLAGRLPAHTILLSLLSRPIQPGQGALW
jgi:hypothetical protein